MRLAPCYPVAAKTHLLGVASVRAYRHSRPMAAVHCMVYLFVYVDVMRWTVHRRRFIPPKRELQSEPSCLVADSRYDDTPNLHEA